MGKKQLKKQDPEPSSEEEVYGEEEMLDDGELQGEEEMDFEEGQMVTDEDQGSEDMVEDGIEEIDPQAMEEGIEEGDDLMEDMEEGIEEGDDLMENIDEDQGMVGLGPDMTGEDMDDDGRQF